MIPATYEYGEYLKDTWGINVDNSALLIQTTSFAPGKYNVTRRDFFNLQELEVTDHDIVGSLQTMRVSFPWCAPLEVVENLPEGVEVSRLITQPFRDGLWGVKNLQKYEEQLRNRDYMTRVEEDLVGPFDLAMAARRDDGKVVVISSREFAVDQVAFAREMMLTAQGFTVRSRNPGNVTLLVNSLHWLNDNTDFMNIGKPIDAAVLEVDQSAVRTVQVLTVVVWPVLAACCGVVAWWIRRR